MAALMLTMSFLQHVLTELSVILGESETLAQTPDWVEAARLTPTWLRLQVTKRRRRK